MGTLALIEVLDRDGAVRLAHKVTAWPLRVGRALDNDLVLDDPHVAAHHFVVGPNEEGVVVTALDTRNGLTAGHQRLAAGERWQAGAVPFPVVAGRTALRVRLAEHALAPERPLAAARALAPRLRPLVLLAVLNLLALAFGTYLESDPEPLARSLAREGMAAFGLVFAWCGAWTLLSKLFTRQGHFLWHVRVLLSASLAWQAVDALLGLAAFSLSWPALTAHAYVAEVAIAALALHAHLQAVEPHRPLMTRAFAVTAFVVGAGLSVWSAWQRTDSTRSELYQARMFPPGLRLAKPVAPGDFVGGLEDLRPDLDASARRPGKDDEDDAADAEGE